MPSDLTPLPKCDGWVQRTMRPPTQLKIAQAPWKDAKNLPAATHARVDDDVLRYHMVRGLVSEIIVAAGGIEREIEALRAARQIAQAYVDTYIKKHIPAPETGPPTVGLNASRHAAYAVMNALTWARAVDDRVRRNDPEGEPAGLLAALEDGPLKTAIECRFENANSALKDARKFGNYVLHAGAIQGGSSPGFAVRQDRTVYFPFPDDPTNNRIDTWEQFRYKDGRDALSYLEKLFATVAKFIDDMLDAFDAQS